MPRITRMCFTQPRCSVTLVVGVFVFYLSYSYSCTVSSATSGLCQLYSLVTWFNDADSGRFVGI